MDVAELMGVVGLMGFKVVFAGFAWDRLGPALFTTRSLNSTLNAICEVKGQKSRQDKMRKKRCQNVDEESRDNQHPRRRR
jgi:hypothetical protein